MIIDSPSVIGTLSAGAGALRARKPLIASTTRAAALAAAADIARAAPSYIPRQPDGTLEPSFSGGASGVAVFLHYAAKVLNDAALHAESVDLLGQALDGLHAMHRTGLFSGYSGVAWVVSHLQQRGVDELDDVDLAEVDAVVDALLRRVPWPDDYDLITGLVGFGVYGLERMRQGAGEEIVASVVKRLAESVEWLGDGLAAWFTAPWLLPSNQWQASPEGNYNIGVAHGGPGVIALLARAAQHDVRRPTCLRLLAAGARWIQAQVRVTGRDDTYIGYSVDPRAGDVENRRSRDAWCYGAPGVSVALLAAAHVLGDAPLADTALALARSAAPHDLMRSGVRDASFCHGSSGLAHLYARLYDATGESVFADAAARWTEQTLAFRTSGEGVAGFFYVSSQNDEMIRVAGSGFLEGAAGIGLVLLAMSAMEPPSWDRVVLADPLLPSLAEAQ